MRRTAWRDQRPTYWEALPGVSARGLDGDLDVAEDLDRGTLMASEIIGMSNRTYPSNTR
jgi:hypothetical protein